MDLLTAIKTIKYPDIVNLISQNPRDQSKLRMLKNLYRYEKNKFNRPEHVVTGALILSLRFTKGKIPAPNYVHKTIESYFQMMTTPEDVVKVLEYRILFEIERNESAEHLKKIAAKESNEESNEPSDDPYEYNQRKRVESNVSQILKKKSI